MNGKGADSGDFVLSATLADVSASNTEIFFGPNAPQTARATKDNGGEVVIEMQAPFAPAGASPVGQWITAATLSLSGGQPPYSGRLLRVNDVYATGAISGVGGATLGRIDSGGGELAVLQIALPSPSYATRTSPPAVLLHYDFVLRDSAGRQNTVRVRATDTLQVRQLAAVPFHFGDTATSLDSVYSGDGTAASPYIVPSLAGAPVLVGELALPSGNDYRVWAGASGSTAGQSAGEVGVLQISFSKGRPALYVWMPRNGDRLQQWHEYIIQYLPTGALRRQTLFVAPSYRASGFQTRALTNNFSYLGGSGTRAAPYQIIANAGSITVGEVTGQGSKQIISAFDYVVARGLSLRINDNVPSFAGSSTNNNIIVPPLSPGQTIRLGLLSHETVTDSGGNNVQTRYAYSAANDIYVATTPRVSGQVAFALITSDVVGERNFPAVALATANMSIAYRGCDSGNANGCAAFAGDIVQVAASGNNYIISMNAVAAGAGGSFLASLFFTGNTHTLVLEVAGVVSLQIQSDARVYIIGTERPAQVGRLSVQVSSSIVPQTLVWMDENGNLFSDNEATISENGRKVFSVVVRDNVWYTAHTPFVATTYTYLLGSSIPQLQSAVSGTLISVDIARALGVANADAVSLVQLSASGGVGYIPAHYRYVLGASAESFLSLSAEGALHFPPTLSKRQKGDLTELLLNHQRRGSGVLQSSIVVQVYDSRRGLPTTAGSTGILQTLSITYASVTLISVNALDFPQSPVPTYSIHLHQFAPASDLPPLSPAGNQLAISLTTDSEYVIYGAVNNTPPPFSLTLLSLSADGNNRHYNIYSTPAGTPPADGPYNLSVLFAKGLSTNIQVLSVSVVSLPLSAAFLDAADKPITQITISLYASQTDYGVRVALTDGRNVFASRDAIYRPPQEAMLNGTLHDLTAAAASSLPLVLQHFMEANTLVEQTVSRLNIGSTATVRYTKNLGEFRRPAGVSESLAVGLHTLIFMGMGEPGSANLSPITLTMMVEQRPSPQDDQSFVAPPVNDRGVYIYLRSIKNRAVTVNGATPTTWPAVGNLTSYLYAANAQVVSMEALRVGGRIDINNHPRNDFWANDIYRRHDVAETHYTEARTTAAPQDIPDSVVGTLRTISDVLTIYYRAGVLPSAPVQMTVLTVDFHLSNSQLPLYPKVIPQKLLQSIRIPNFRVFHG